MTQAVHYQLFSNQSKVYGFIRMSVDDTLCSTLALFIIGLIFKSGYRLNPRTYEEKDFHLFRSVILLTSVCFLVSRLMSLFKKQIQMTLFELTLSLDGRALRSAPDYIRANPYLALLAIKDSTDAFEYVSDDLKASPSFILDAIRFHAGIYTHIPDLFFHSKSFSLRAVALNTDIISYLPRHYMNDEDLVLSLVPFEPRVVLQASSSLKAKADFYLKGIARNYCITQYVPGHFLKQRVFVEAAINVQPQSISFFPSEYKRNFAIIKAAFQKSPKALKGLDEDLCSLIRLKTMCRIATKKKGKSFDEYRRLEMIDKVATFVFYHFTTPTKKPKLPPD